MTATFTTTYTESDIQKVFNRFEADLYMIVHSTGLESASWAESQAHDLTLMAVLDLVGSVHVMLFDARGVKTHVEVYTPSKDAASWTAARPGGCLWPRTPGGRLSAVVHYTPKRAAMTAAESELLARLLRLHWSATSDSTDHTGLAATGERLYTSSAYGLRHVSYRRVTR